jgi:dTDP-4-amino-4,6-dideoxygalactose transaminase
MIELNTLGVPCTIGSCSEIYMEKAFHGTDMQPSERLPVAKELGETSLMFLVHPTLDEDQMHKVASAIESVMGEATAIQWSKAA